MYYLLTFILLMGTWILLSGIFDLFHLSLGVISSVIVTVFSHDLLFKNRQRSLTSRMVEAVRATNYFRWLLWQIVLANIHVLILALHPRSREKIEPQIIRFNTRLRSDFAKFVFANSITLTPGTVTVRIVEDEFVVHAISDKVAADLPGEMERRVAHAFDRNR